MTSFDEITADLPRVECWVDGHPDGYRATATFGDDLCAVVIDPEMSFAVMFANAQLKAMIAARRDG